MNHIIIFILLILFYLFQVAQDPQHIVIRYKHADGFQNNHGDRNYAKRCYNLSTSLRLK